MQYCNYLFTGPECRGVHARGGGGPQGPQAREPALLQVGGHARGGGGPQGPQAREPALLQVGGHGMQPELGTTHSFRLPTSLGNLLYSVVRLLTGLSLLWSEYRHG